MTAACWQDGTLESPLEGSSVTDFPRRGHPIRTQNVMGQTCDPGRAASRRNHWSPAHPSYFPHSVRPARTPVHSTQIPASQGAERNHCGQADGP